MKKILGLTICIFLFLFGINVEAKTIKVTMPSFPITINGVVEEQDYLKYPIIFYNNLTYFPLSFNRATSLGYNAFWNNNERTIRISKQKIAGYLLPEKSTTKNKKNLSATTTDIKVEINDEKFIDTADYPILIFRDIIYLPFSWDFSQRVNANFSFDNKNGLVIDGDIIKKRPLGQRPENVEKLWEYSYQNSDIEYKESYEISGKKFLIGRDERKLEEVISEVVDGKAVVLKKFTDRGHRSSSRNIDGNYLYYVYENSGSFREGELLTYQIKRINLMNMEEELLKELKIPAPGKVSMVALNGKIFYGRAFPDARVDSEKLLYSQDDKVIGGPILFQFKRFENYVVATFETEDNIIVYDENQRVVAKANGNYEIEYIDIKDGVLSYRDKRNGKLVTIKL